MCDEIQAVKGGSVRFQNVLDLTEPSPRILAMTATPMQNDVVELWHVLAVLHLSDLVSKHEFGQRYAIWSEAYQPDKTKPWIVVEPQPIGLVEENLGELRAFLFCHTHRVAPLDAGVAMPKWDLATGPRWPRPSQAQNAAHASSGGGGTGYIKATTAGRVAAGESALVDEFMRLLDREFASEPKVIVYCETLAVLPILCEQLDAAGFGYRAIEGKVASKDRDMAIEDFRNDPTVRVLVGSRVLETGLNLQCARLLVSLDCSDNPMRERQREGRVRRIGSAHESVSHVTLLPDTPTVRTKWARLATKERDVRRVLGPADHDVSFARS